MNKKVLDKFKGAFQIMSYRMGTDLTQPYDKYVFNIYENGVVKATQEQISNYENNGIKTRDLLIPKTKNFSYKQTMEVINGTRAKC